MIDDVKIRCKVTEFRNVAYNEKRPSCVCKKGRLIERGLMLAVILNRFAQERIVDGNSTVLLEVLHGHHEEDTGKE